MNLKELCEARYSCRLYQEKPIEAEKLEYIKECVRLAPSAVNRQPWKFLLITDPAQLDIVKACYKREWIQTAPAIVMCLKNESECWTRRYDSHSHADIDIAIATEHLCLAATEQGLAGCWVCNFDIEMLRSTFPIPEGYDPAVLVPLGYPADEPAPKVRKPLDEVWA
ncbi:MAG: nitroreductase family protein [Bacteroidales bacterium]|nr:nitroreductase family protein [Candidatus Physcousia equi]